MKIIIEKLTDDNFQLKIATFPPDAFNKIFADKEALLSLAAGLLFVISGMGPKMTWEDKKRDGKETK